MEEVFDGFFHLIYTDISTFCPAVLAGLAAIFIIPLPPILSLISPLLLLVLASHPDLFSHTECPNSQSAGHSTLSLSAQPAPLPLFSPSPASFLQSGVFLYLPRVSRRDRRFIKVSRYRSICWLLNDCPGKGANISSYRTWSAVLTRSCLSRRT